MQKRTGLYRTGSIAAGAATLALLLPASVTQAGGCTSSSFSYNVKSINYCTNTACIDFTGLANGLHGDETFCWNWGDGSPQQCDSPGLSGDKSYTRSACHAFTLGTVYTISLTVTPAHSNCIVETSISFDPGAYVKSATCPGDNDGCIIYNPNPQGTFLNYLWSNGATTKDICNLTPGTYTISISDNNGCQMTDQMTIGATPPISIAVDNSGCSGGNASISVTGGTPPNPDPNPFFEDFNNYVSGTISSGGGNPFDPGWNSSYPGSGTTNNDSWAVRGGVFHGKNLYNGEAVWETNCIDVRYCNNNQLSLDLWKMCSDAGADDYFRAYYSCNGGAETQLMDISYSDLSGVPCTRIANIPNCATCLKIIVRAKRRVPCGCSNSNPPASSPCYTSSGANGAPGCAGGQSWLSDLFMDNVSVTCTPTNPPPYTYQWCNGETTEDITNMPPAGCCVTVTDGNGCTNSECISCCTLVISPTSTNVSCNGGNNGTGGVTVTTGTSPYTYTWSNGRSTASITGLTAGTYTVTVNSNDGCQRTEVITVTEPPPLTQTVTPTHIQCAGDGNGTVSVTAGGGTPGYTYQWSAGGSGSTQTGLSGGSYTVTVTDANGCLITATTTVNEPPPVVLTPSSTDATCGNSDGTVGVTASGGTPGYTYQWSAGGSGSTQTGLGAGVYTVTVTDANGCALTTTTSVNAFGAPGSTIAGVNPLCAGDNNGSIDLSPTGGTPAYTFTWSNGGSGEDLSGLSPGTYSVTITDSQGCSSYNTFTITAPPPLTQSVTPTHILCAGDGNGAVSVTIGGGTPGYTYQWSAGGSGTTQTGLSGGTYTVTVTDANGCVSTGSTTVNEPPPVVLTPSSTDATCGNSDGTVDVTATGGTPGYTYQWSAGGSGSTQTGLGAGVYTVTVTDANNCQITATTSVNAFGAPSSTIAGVNPLCAGDNNGSIDLSPTGGTPAYTFTWSNGGSDEDLSGLSPGTYSVTITDSQGCSSYNTFTITAPPPLTQTVTPTHILCAGDGNGAVSVTIGGGTPAYTYQWSAGGSGSTQTGLSGGTYTVTVTDANGCLITATTTVNEPPPMTISVSPDQTICPQTQSTATITATSGGGTGGHTYSWSNSGSGTSQTVSPTVTTTYTVTATDANGCNLTGSVTIFVSCKPLVTMVPDSFCLGECADLMANALGGQPGYSYTWNPSLGSGPGPHNVCPTATTTYSVTITDQNGDTASATTTVTVFIPPVPVTSHQDATCGQCDGTASVTASGNAPFTYQWSNGCAGSTCTGLCPGTYSVTVTDSKGCSSTGSETVVNIGAPKITADSTDVSCNGTCDGTASVTVTAPGTPPYTYQWSAGGSGTTQSGLCAGTYSVTITDAIGCQDIAITTVNEPPPLAVTPSATDEICGNCQGTASAPASGGIPGYTYLWGNGETGQSLSGLCAGAYGVTITDATGCVITATTTVNNQQVLPNANFTPNPSEVNILNPVIAFIDKSSGAVTWSWDFGDNTTSDLPNPVHTYGDTGCYDVTLMIENQYGCRDTIPQVVCVKDITTIYIPNAFTPNGDGTNEWFTVKEYNYCEFELFIFDRWGNLIYETTSLKGWDGTANGGTEIVQEDVYVWVVDAADCYGTKWRRIGHVTVLR